MQNLYAGMARSPGYLAGFGPFVCIALSGGHLGFWIHGYDSRLQTRRMCLWRLRAPVITFGILGGLGCPRLHLIMARVYLPLYPCSLDNLNTALGRAGDLA